MKQEITPDSIFAPFARYSHAVEAKGTGNMLFASGQLGIDPDGSVPESARDQAELCFANIDAILEEAGYSRRDVVRINAYVSGREHLAGYMAARDGWIEDIEFRPASTLFIVAGFTRPEFRVEVEVTAAR
ncbi:MAG: RidA family protein [Albidovulum sp.]|nr:RidA family protein [Albidovulum sp.]MDE0530289.1 RidA family protein [Albidovulum sp.]